MSKRNDDKSTDLLLTKSRNVLGNLSKEERNIFDFNQICVHITNEIVHFLLEISKKSDLLTNSSESNKSRSNELLNSCLRKCPSVQCNDELYTFQDRILHHKCAVVKLVRNQMSEFSNILDDETDLLNKLLTRYSSYKTKMQFKKISGKLH